MNLHQLRIIAFTCLHKQSHMGKAQKWHTRNTQNLATLLSLESPQFTMCHTGYKLGKQKESLG